MRPAEFWCSTLPEINVFLEGTALAYRDAADLAKLGAWYSAVLAGQERLTPLEELLEHKPKSRRERRQGKEEVIQQWKSFFARRKRA